MIAMGVFILVKVIYSYTHPNLDPLQKFVRSLSGQHIASWALTSFVSTGYIGVLTVLHLLYNVVNLVLKEWRSGT